MYYHFGDLSDILVIGALSLVYTLKFGPVFSEEMIISLSMRLILVVMLVPLMACREFWFIAVYIRIL